MMKTREYNLREGTIFYSQNYMALEYAIYRIVVRKGEKADELWF